MCVVSKMRTLTGKTTIKSVTDEILLNIPVGSEFHALDLQRNVTRTIYRRTGMIRVPFPDTVLRYLRYAREDGEFVYKCVSREKSLYRKERV